MAIKTFTKWCEEKDLSLPVLTDEKPNTKKTIEEKQARAGIAHWAYPDAYVRQQYPDGYFMPRAADAQQKMGSHQPSRKGG